MKTIEQQIKNASFMILAFSFVLIAISTFSGCGSETSIITGPRGATGADGATGATGAPGGNCSVQAVAPDGDVAPYGASLIVCPDGSQALVLNGTPGEKGDTGDTGAQGNTGATGATGAAGTPGTVITPIQFCSGTGSYPSTFPEVGFCLNNELYAVYSAHGGFLTKVLPGTWSSNGINSSCTFTVGPNCAVSR